MVEQTQTASGPPGGVDHRWAVILAGGEGRRLLTLTRTLSGDDRPKQFCKVLGEETLLAQTQRRVERVVSPNRTFSVVTKAHESFYREQMISACGPGHLVQPCNRGTGPAIVYSLMRLHKIDSKAVVGFFPSDHHFGDDEAFCDCVHQAFECAEANSDRVILLGIEPSQPETGYGWIEPGDPLSASGPGLIFGVRRFWEKPSREAATELMRRGCLWNSFIMVGTVGSFLSLTGRATPYLFRAFQRVIPALLTREEEASVFDVYLNTSSSSFSADVLSICPGGLGVLSSRTLEWTDVGDVARALALIGSAAIGLPRRMPGSSEQKATRLAAAAG